MTRRTIAGKKKSAARTRFEKTRGWIAAGTLAAYAVMGGTRSALAEKEKNDAAGSSTAEATLPLKRFDIAAGPLDKAVQAYEKSTGLTVKVVLPAGTLAGFNSPGVLDFIAKTRPCVCCWRGRVLTIASRMQRRW